MLGWRDVVPAFALLGCAIALQMLYAPRWLVIFAVLSGPTVFTLNLWFTIQLRRRRRIVQWPSDVPSVAICLIYDGRDWDGFVPLLRFSYELAERLKWHFAISCWDDSNLRPLFEKFAKSQL